MVHMLVLLFTTRTFLRSNYYHEFVPNYTQKKIARFGSIEQESTRTLQTTTMPLLRLRLVTLD